MSSPIHSKVLSRLSLLVPSVVLMCFSLTVRADLEVEWIDANTIRVYGTGSGGDQTVVTNWMGCCTNCTLITPEELNTGMGRIINLSSQAQIRCDEVIEGARILKEQIDEDISEISTFQRFPSSGRPPTVFTGANASLLDSFTNYLFSTDNIQTRLTLSFAPGNFGPYNLVTTQAMSYNDGIYDYANQNVSPRLYYYKDTLSNIQTDSQDIKTSLLALDDVARGFQNLQSCPCGDDSSEGVGGCAWTQDQIDALFDYVDHIDQDQHKRFNQLNAMSNNVANIDERMDSYAKLVSGVLYQDGTIQLDDGESWTNVYFRGESENYSYDKSNILQRIELILFGMAHSTTNFSLDASSVTNQLDDTAVNNVTNQFNEFSSDSTNSFLNAKEKLEAKVNSIKSISAMFVFWGTAGSDSPFTLGYVPNLDGSGGGQYIEVGNGFLGTEVSRFRQLCRYGFQLIWATSFLFLIWLFYVRLFKYVVIFLKYAFEWINEAFAS